MDIDRLRELRKKLNLTQSDVGKALGFARQRYNFYETGNRQPDNETLVKLAEYFNVSTDYLLGVSDYMIIEEKKKSPSEIQMSDISYALFGEVRELDDEDREELLRAARRMRELRDLKEQNKKRQG